MKSRKNVKRGRHVHQGGVLQIGGWPCPRVPERLGMSRDAGGNRDAPTGRTRPCSSWGGAGLPRCGVRVWAVRRGVEALARLSAPHQKGAVRAGRYAKMG